MTRADLRAALEVVYDVHAEQSSHPFPTPVLGRLGDLVGVHGVGYCEVPRLGGPGGYALRNRPDPPWLCHEVERWAHQDPTSCPRHVTSAAPLAISDFLTWRAFTRLEVYDHICRRNDVADSLRLYLPPTPTTARFFFFNKEKRGFATRERDLLQLLRPHLASWRRRWGAATEPKVLGLTRRELEILEAVAGGATNREIAEQLWISPHTVRTHLENVFEKLGAPHEPRQRLSFAATPADRPCVRSRRVVDSRCLFGSKRAALALVQRST